MINRREDYKMAIRFINTLLKPEREFDDTNIACMGALIQKGEELGLEVSNYKKERNKKQLSKVAIQEKTNLCKIIILPILKIVLQKDFKSFIKCPMAELSHIDVLALVIRTVSECEKSLLHVGILSKKDTEVLKSLDKLLSSNPDPRTFELTGEIIIASMMVVETLSLILWNDTSIPEEDIKNYEMSESNC